MKIISGILVKASKESLPTNKSNLDSLLTNKDFSLVKAKTKPFIDSLLYKGKLFAKVAWSYESKGTGIITFEQPENLDTYLDGINQ